MDASNPVVQDAAAATGDEILVAASFQPKGMSGSALGGFGSGTGVGSAVGESLSGDAPGEAGDNAAFGDRAEGLTPVVAVSGSRIYVLGPDGEGGLTTVHTFHRGIAHVSVHSRLTVKTLVIEDPETRTTVELEAERLRGHEAQDVIEEMLRDHG
jgi:hypothetical protein